MPVNCFVEKGKGGGECQSARVLCFHLSVLMSVCIKPSIKGKEVDYFKC